MSNEVLVILVSLATVASFGRFAGPAAMDKVMLLIFVCLVPVAVFGYLMGRLRERYLVVGIPLDTIFAIAIIVFAVVGAVIGASWWLYPLVSGITVLGCSVQVLAAGAGNRARQPKERP